MNMGVPSIKCNIELSYLQKWIWYTNNCFVFGVFTVDISNGEELVSFDSILATVTQKSKDTSSSHVTPTVIDIQEVDVRNPPFELLIHSYISGLTTHTRFYGSSIIYLPVCKYLVVAPPLVYYKQLLHCDVIYDCIVTSDVNRMMIMMKIWKVSTLQKK